MLQCWVVGNRLVESIFRLSSERVSHRTMVSIIWGWKVGKGEEAGELKGGGGSPFTHPSQLALSFPSPSTSFTPADHTFALSSLSKLPRVLLQTPFDAPIYTTRTHLI